MKRMFKRTKAYILFMLIMVLFLQNLNLEVFAEDEQTVWETSKTDDLINTYNQISMVASDSNARYYLTECEKPDEKNDVNLAGTGYDHALFNPKNNETGTTVPWYISLGEHEAMCVTFNGHASMTNQKHYYALSDINSLKTNPYFEGGTAYPVEAYLKGVCYAYETLTYPEQYVDKTYLDAGRAELIRKTNPYMVWYSGKAVNYAVHQIITWRISSGSFNPDNLEYEHNLAKLVFDQMYPGSEWEGYAAIIVDFYDYYVLCAKEAASGNYTEKYDTTQIKYWTVQNSEEYTDLSQWQDFITWEIPKSSKVPGTKIIDVYKYGTNTNILVPGAEYGIYSDAACTNKLGTYTSDDSGNFKIWAIEGNYYLKELSAPFGTVKDTNIYALDIRDNTESFSVKNEEVFNYLEVYKFEEETGKIITEQAKFDLYEYNCGTGSYLRMGELVHDGNGGYSVKPSQNYTYHFISGATAKTINTDKIYYTAANQGRFKIVETIAPAGWKKAEDKEFTMNASVNGYFRSFHTYGTGITEQPYYCGVSLIKYDALTADRLSGAKFIVQENVGGNWYDVGELEEVIRNDKSGAEYSAYQTSEKKRYFFHDENGMVCQTVSNEEYPLHRTVCNRGRFRLVETETSNEYYVGEWIKEFDIAPKEDNKMICFEEFGNSAPENRGNGNQLNILKYDAITGEVIGFPAVITVYEHIETLDEWFEVGNLRYDKEQQQYTTAGVSYRLHNTDGTDISVLSDTACLPGYIYYTSANKGRYKLVETVAPINYEAGRLCLEPFHIEVFEKEFTISKQDGEVLDFTDISSAAQDTGISANVELVKYDAMTEQRVKEGDAEFTVYEKIGNDWFEAGTMVYDVVNGEYTTRGMKLTLHNNRGECVYTEDFAQGLYYTTANQGVYRVIETKAPTGYVTGSRVFIKEFNLTADSENGVIRFDKIENAAVNTGVSGFVKVAKFDNITKEKVLTGDAVFTVYEYIEAIAAWLEVGTLSYNAEKQEYDSEGQDFIFHDAEGNELDTTETEEYEMGKLYRTSANLGRFKVKETKAPTGYTLASFDIDFDITGSKNVYEFVTTETGAVNTGISGVIKLVKADCITNEPLTGAVFILQEWSSSNSRWVDAGILKDNLDGTYTTDICMIHTGENEEILPYPSLIYTTQNLGRFRVVEKEAPKGYINDNFISGELNLSEENTEFILDNEQTVKNTPIRVGISKKSAITGQDIAGAELTVKDSGGAVIDTWTSDGMEHIISAIPAGKYVLIEERAPEGYVLTGSVEFEVLETGEIQRVEMFNKEVKGKVMIDKVDKDTGETLAGAEFVLKDGEGNRIQTLTTDENGHAESDLLSFGIYDANGKYLGSKQYTLTEVAAPDGYKLISEPYDIEFEYRDDETEVVERSITIENEKEAPALTGDKTEKSSSVLLLIAAVFVLCAGEICRNITKRAHK